MGFEGEHAWAELAPPVLNFALTNCFLKIKPVSHRALLQKLNPRHSLAKPYSHLSATLSAPYIGQDATGRRGGRRAGSPFIRGPQRRMNYG
jgi:hypothetical protein